ncbi:MAG: metabolite traffic protein EboE [Verrucomicrobiales bacterium]
MRLKHDIDLGYCTNIHRGETWEETFHALSHYTDKVRRRVAPGEPYGIGLRLSAAAAAELASDVSLRDAFRRWMDERNAYVFTVNGFPYGTFHGGRVKEQVYSPDWSTPERLEYTNRLFDLIVELAPEGRSVSVSTLPGSFKEFIRPDTAEEQVDEICRHLTACSEHIESLREKTGRDVHLGLEPEPLGLFETSAETAAFFDRLLRKTDAAGRERFLRNVGVNYDTCHLAVEFEEPADAIGRLREAGIRISKIHLSSALKLIPNEETVARLETFQDDVYLHQVVVRKGRDIDRRFKDLPEAISWFGQNRENPGDEWRVHFHVPLHSQPEALFADTRDHISDLLALLADEPECCRHFEMETYTWEVLPEAMRSGDVVDQLVAEYDWCLGEFGRVGLA